MGIDTINCKCNCEEDQGASFIIEEISDDYLPIKRKRHSIIKNVNSLFCSSCKREIDNKFEIKSLRSKKISDRIIPIETNIYEFSEPYYQKGAPNQSYNKYYQNKEATINNINIIYNQNYILNNKNFTKEKFKENIILNIQISYIICLQAVIRGWLLRERYNSELKSILIEEEKALIKNKIESYTNKNISLLEKLYGEFDRGSWKEFYKDGDYLFLEKTKENIYKKYKIKKLKNIVYNFNFVPKTNPDFLIENIDEEPKNNDNKLYNEIIEKKFHPPSKIFYNNSIKCKLKISNMIDETIYIGSVNIEGERHGYGTLIKKNGIKIEGWWHRGKFEGWGRISDGEGVFYEGYFINGKINGKGKKMNIDGYKYKGEFYLGKKEGIGKEETKKTIYEGDFHKDLKCGRGKCIFTLLEEKYEGEFENNLINGKGLYEWKNGNSYKGSFINGKMNGLGLFTWKDGSQYYGYYKDNLKEGKGKFTWPNGKCFEGNFKNGNPHGEGKLSTLDENKDIISSDLVIYNNGELNKLNKE